MFRTTYSSVLSQSAEQVWDLIRDFNNYPVYIDGVTESIIEDDKRGDETGAVRRFCYGGAWLRQCLTSHSDTERSFSYAGMEPFQFPDRQDTDTPAAANYKGTLRITPIIDGARTFIEWYVEVDCPPADAERWNAVLIELIPQWVESLRRTLDRR